MQVFEVQYTHTMPEFDVAAVSDNQAGFWQRTLMCFSRLLSSIRNLEIVKTTIRHIDTKNVAIVLEYITKADIYKKT